jgi:putative aminopeptidase FrvX
VTQTEYHWLKRLSEAFGPSGCEDEVRQVVLEAIQSKVDEVQVDALGNVIAMIRGTANPGFKVMVAAHMDEVGMMISHIGEDGLLRFTKVGGIDDRVLPAKGIRIRPRILADGASGDGASGDGAGNDKLPGVITIKPVHLTTQAERSQVMSYDKLAIDIGAGSKKEAEGLVDRGAYATFDIAFSDLGDVVKGKAFDDRAGCAMLIALIERGPYPFDFYPVFTTMEEVGLRGARVAGYSVMPDAAFVLEGTICDDSPKKEDLSPTTELGKGPAISVMDRSVVADRRLLQLVVETAEQEGIPYQFKQPGKGGTDAGAIHLAKTGVPTLPVCVPSRYIHSPVSVLSKSDYEQTINLMAASLMRLTPQVVGARE